MGDRRPVVKKDDRDTRTAPPVSLPPGFAFCTSGDAALIVRNQYGGSRPLSEILTGNPVPIHTGPSALSGGRGSASVHTVSGIGDVVLRRYRRGGLIGKVLFDRYLSGARPFRELAVLALAHSRGVPVPEVIGASSTRAGLIWYRGRIVTRLIPGSVTLPVFIEKNRGDTNRLAAILKRAGAAVRAMHDAGIDHADLNMNNILVDKKGAVFIIDFDKATMHPELGKRGRIRNLKRMLRSLRKLKSAGQPLEDSDFSLIIRGYAGNDAPLLAEIERKTLQSRLLLFRSAIRMFFKLN